MMSFAQFHAVKDNAFVSLACVDFAKKWAERSWPVALSNVQPCMKCLRPLENVSELEPGSLTFPPLGFPF